MFQSPGVLFAGGPGRGGLLVEEGGLGRGPAGVAHGPDDHRVFIRPEAQPEFVADLHLTRWFRSVAVHGDLAAGDRVDGNRTRLEEPRGPEPLVEADRAERFASGFPCHIQKILPDPPQGRRGLTTPAAPIDSTHALALIQRTRL